MEDFLTLLDDEFNEEEDTANNHGKAVVFQSQAVYVMVAIVKMQIAKMKGITQVKIWCFRGAYDAHDLGPVYMERG